MRTFFSYALRLCEIYCFQVVQNMVLKPFVLNWAISQLFDQSIIEFDPLCRCVWVVQNRTVQIHMKLVTCISTMLIRDFAEFFYQSNVLPGQWTWLGIHELLWLRVLWGGGEGGGGGGGTKSSRAEKKNKNKHFWASDFYLFPLSH